jgi:hypothetical protein
MRLYSRKLFFASAVVLSLLASSGFAGDHQRLNGTWTLLPTRSDFGGQPMLQTGSVTINDRERNITVSRSFSYEGANQSVSYTFTTDSQENATVRQGKTFKSKARWDDKVLKVTTVGENMTENERYSLTSDGMLMVVVERPGHPVQTLYFQRQ